MYRSFNQGLGFHPLTLWKKTSRLNEVIRKPRATKTRYAILSVNTIGNFSRTLPSLHWCFGMSLTIFQFHTIYHMEHSRQLFWHRIYHRKVSTTLVNFKGKIIMIGRFKIALWKPSGYWDYCIQSHHNFVTAYFVKSFRKLQHFPWQLTVIVWGTNNKQNFVFSLSLLLRQFFQVQSTKKWAMNFVKIFKEPFEKRRLFYATWQLTKTIILIINLHLEYQQRILWWKVQLLDGLWYSKEGLKRSHSLLKGPWRWMV